MIEGRPEIKEASSPCDSNIGEMSYSDICAFLAKQNVSIVQKKMFNEFFNPLVKFGDFLSVQRIRIFYEHVDKEGKDHSTCFTAYVDKLEHIEKSEDVAAVAQEADQKIQEAWSNFKQNLNPYTFKTEISRACEKVTRKIMFVYQDVVLPFWSGKKSASHLLVVVDEQTEERADLIADKIT